MPIRELFLQAKSVGADLAPPTAIAAVLAALVFLLFAWPWKSRGTDFKSILPIRTAVSGVLSVSVGFVAGCWWLGVRPHWPPLEDQDRLLLILLPAVIVVEIAVALLKPLAYAAGSGFEIRNPKSEISTSDIGTRIWSFRV